MAVGEREKGMAKTAVLPAPEVAPQRENALVRGRAFLSDVREELQKVSSPSRAEVQATTTVVILAVFIFAGFFYLVDTVLGYVLQALLHALGGA